MSNFFSPYQHFVRNTCKCCGKFFYDENHMTLIEKAQVDEMIRNGDIVKDRETNFYTLAGEENGK